MAITQTKFVGACVVCFLAGWGANFDRKMITDVATDLKPEYKVIAINSTSTLPKAAVVANSTLRVAANSTLPSSQVVDTKSSPPSLDEATDSSTIKKTSPPPSQKKKAAKKSQSGKKIIAVAAHHKTGTVLNIEMIKAFVKHRNNLTYGARRKLIDELGWTRLGQMFQRKDSSSNYAFIEASHAQHWPLHHHEDGGLQCVVHQTRLPIDMIVSGFLYHTRLIQSKDCPDKCGEQWIWNAKVNPCPVTAAEHFPADGLMEMTYRDTIVGLEKISNTTSLLCQTELTLTRDCTMMLEMMQHDLEHLDKAVQMNLNDWKGDQFDGNFRKVFRACQVEEKDIEEALLEYQKKQRGGGMHFNSDKSRENQLKDTLREWAKEMEGKPNGQGAEYKIKRMLWNVTTSYDRLREEFLAKKVY